MKILLKYPAHLQAIQFPKRKIVSNTSCYIFNEKFLNRRESLIYRKITQKQLIHKATFTPHNTF